MIGWHGMEPPVPPVAPPAPASAQQGVKIGLITITMGVMQIIAAPFTVLLDRYFDARVLTAVGFIVFITVCASSVLA